MLIALFGIVLVCFLVALSIIDVRAYILPDYLTLPLIGLGLAFSYTQNNFTAALIGASIGYIGFVLLETVYKTLKKRDGLGRGDAKLLAAGGAWCGWFGLPFIILIASAFGLVHALTLAKKQTEALPFGPHLAAGIFLMWISLYLLK